ncbi:Na(+) H(+) antiporter [Hyphodiscus hymeniophilus]|uniref:Na(+) H(+) antiporter n=1 Tax=Hyphodiscus hymeniophilus TaxID=353542 RepID=A0A9P7AWV3_9HELO|nr:Na(+) H(+) antiporter [Hyphodiscus hymeniophilus]
MAWDHLAINRPHLVYIILGGFTSLFMLCSSFIKERLYIGEATVATICGIIFGPHAANLINPDTWGNTDQVTLEFSRIVLVVQCFAVGVELPKYYMEKHWRSVVFLLIPVMTFGWLITSLFIWWMIPTLNWLQSLCCAACVTATDPVLASSVVGKGKFAKRVPKHLRDLLSAESGCNDGMAFPFIYLALYLIQYRPDKGEVAFNWICITILYECVFGAIYGFLIGYIGRHGIKYAEKKDLVDRESFLVFYFVLALFCAGSGSILGVDDLLVGFAAGVGFSNDGWFTQKTEESHVSNVIDLLLNLAYFVYLGTIIPWEQYNNPSLGTTPWRLVVIALFVIFFRRIPIMMALKPLIPDIKTWREALFAGHFGPIGVGAIFVAILARADLETGGTTPLASYPDPSSENYMLVALIWPITTFLVISSIIVHGSSIAVFTLGKHINTLTLTMSYTTAGEDGPGWLNRLPRISSTSRSQAKSFGSETEGEELNLEDMPPGTLPPVGLSGQFLRRQKEEDNPSHHGSRSSSLIPRRRKKKWDDGRGPGGPISQSAIFPQRRSHSDLPRESTSDTLTPGENSPDNEKNDLAEQRAGDGHEKDDDDERLESPLGEVQHDPEMEAIMHRHSKEENTYQHKSDAERHPEHTNVYQEGNHIVIENDDGEVLTTQESPAAERRHQKVKEVEKEVKGDLEHPSLGYKNLRKKMGVWRHKDEQPEAEASEKPRKQQQQRKRGPALAYQFGNTIIVEDEDGEVVKTYELPSKPRKEEDPSVGAPIRQGVKRVGTWTGLGKDKPEITHPEPESGKAEASSSAVRPDPPRQGLSRMGTWGFGGKSSEATKNERAMDHSDEDDDRRIRFTIGGAGRRLTKEDFLKEIRSLDPKARSEIIEESDAPASMKFLAKKDASKDSPGSSRLFEAKNTQAAAGKGEAKSVGAEMAKQRGARLDESDEEFETPQEKRKTKADPVPAKSTTTMSSNAKTSSGNEPESAAERKRREKALRGVDDVTDAQRGRSPTRDGPVEPEETAAARRRRLAMEGGGGTNARIQSPGVEGESAAERRRREAALRVDIDQDDSDDDDTPRIPPPVARSRGIRFAQSPVRGRK